jgi:chemotaxis protein CheX
MTMTSFSDETVSEITREIWSAIIDDSGSLVARRAAGDYGDLTGSVDISGSWNGTFYLSFSNTAARQAAAKMFDQDPGDLSDADISDAVGELINIIGGNLKSLLPPPALLSLPKVTTGLPTPTHLHEAEMVSELRFAWLDEPIVVAVWREPDGQ